MLDVMIPVSARNVALAPECVESIMKHTDVPYRLIVVADGIRAGELSILEGLVKTLVKPNDWVISILPRGSGFNVSLREAVEQVTNQFVALVPPHIHLTDSKWFGKMQAVFLRDKTTYMVDCQHTLMAGVEKRSHAIPPARRERRSLARDTRFFMSRKPVLEFLHPAMNLTSTDIVYEMEEESLRQGGTVWSHPGVGFDVIDCEEHECLGSLVKTIPSESSLPTTLD